MSRKKPNILIAGTPGVGKSSIAKRVSKLTGLKYVNISLFAISKKLIAEHDDEMDCEVIDEDKVIAKLKKKAEKGGLLIEYHSCEFFPKEWFDKVYVIRASISVLHDRLVERDYSDSKRDENMECEIFQVCLEEAYETFGTEIVLELVNDDKKHLKKNIKFIVNDVESLKKKFIENESE